MSFADSLGLIVNLTLGGMAMFFIILMLSFLGTKIAIKQNHFKGSSVILSDVETEQMIKEDDVNDHDYEHNEQNDVHQDDIYTISERVGDEIDLFQETDQFVESKEDESRRTLKISNFLRLTRIKKFN